MQTIEIFVEMVHSYLEDQEWMNGYLCMKIVQTIHDVDNQFSKDVC